MVEQATLPAEDTRMRNPIDVDKTESRATHTCDEHSLADASPANGSGQRRQFLKCMAWAGAGTLWLMKGGVLQAKALDALGGDASARDASFSFVQISDSHIGFNKAPNSDVTPRCSRRSARSTRSIAHRISSSTPAISPICPSPSSSTRWPK